MSPAEPIEEQVHSTLRRARTETGMPVLFGGLVEARELPLSSFVGTRTGLLKGLTIGSRRGLGGRVLHDGRPGQVVDYSRSTAITHEYDRQVGGEGIETLVAVPAVVGGRTRAVIYGGLRSVARVPDRMLGALSGLAAELADEIRIDDEVSRRLSALRQAIPAGRRASAPLDEQLALAITESIVELDELARTAPGTDLAATLAGIGDRLRAARAPSGPPPVALSDRERQVLAHLALGSSNREIAERLSLAPETVKSYVRTLYGKLDVHSRHQAVVAGRRFGLLP